MLYHTTHTIWLIWRNLSKESKSFRNWIRTVSFLWPLQSRQTETPVQIWVLANPRPCGTDELVSLSVICWSWLTYRVSGWLLIVAYSGIWRDTQRGSNQTPRIWNKLWSALHGCPDVPKKALIFGSYWNLKTNCPSDSNKRTIAKRQKWRYHRLWFVWYVIHANHRCTGLATWLALLPYYRTTRTAMLTVAWGMQAATNMIFLLRL